MNEPTFARVVEHVPQCVIITVKNNQCTISRGVVSYSVTGAWAPSTLNCSENVHHIWGEMGYLRILMGTQFSRPVPSTRFEKLRPWQSVTDPVGQDKPRQWPGPQMTSPMLIRNCLPPPRENFLEQRLKWCRIKSWMCKTVLKQWKIQHMWLPKVYYVEIKNNLCKFKFEPYELGRPFFCTLDGVWGGKWMPL